MLSPSPPSLKRSAIWLGGGLILASALLIGFLAGSTRGTRSRAGGPRTGEPGGWSPTHWFVSGRGSGRSGAGGTETRGVGHEDAEAAGSPAFDSQPGVARSLPRRRDAEAGDESTLEEMERRLAAGMTRARESVVALEYVATEAPAGSRRLATGVVINEEGDVLSVRIDPPSATPRAGVSGGLATIVARDVL